MIIKDIYIRKFRGFNKQRLTLGENITVIAGQNGSQKSTLLGILSQTFTLGKNHPLANEKPLSGGNYKSLFNEKFKLSKEFDKAGNHEWTLNLTSENPKSFTAESIYRDKKEGTIRFWQKGRKDAGDGYLQYPVIFLSLKRLLPLGEDKGLSISQDITLDEKEKQFYQEWHNKILIITKPDDSTVDYIASKEKQTLGISSKYYDWQSNSAGQDNIGKILLSILSFRRLKEQYPKQYNGGLLVIDELDATLYPASQIKLFKALQNFSSKFKIQIIFTTHSYNLIRSAHKIQSSSPTSDQVKVALLRKYDHNIKIIEGLKPEEIERHLNIESPKPHKLNKILVFTEDAETKIFFKGLLKNSRSKRLDIVSACLGCGNLLELASKKVPSFRGDESLIVLDGDVELNSKYFSKVKKIENVLILPGQNSPEKLLSKLLYDLPEDSPYWGQIEPEYTHQIAFKDYSYAEVKDNRDTAKAWFNEQKSHWGRGCSRIINVWIASNQEAVNVFFSEFNKKLKNYLL